MSIDVHFRISPEAVIIWVLFHEFDEICFPVAQMVEHGASNAKIMGSIPRENKS